MMNTELEGVLDRLFGGLEDLCGRLEFDRDRDRVEVGVRVFERWAVLVVIILDLETRDLDFEEVGVGVLVRVRVGVRVGVGRGVLVELADGHRKGPVLPGPTKRPQDPEIGPETVPAEQRLVSRHHPQKGSATHCKHVLDLSQVSMRQLP